MPQTEGLGADRERLVLQKRPNGGVVDPKGGVLGRFRYIGSLLVRQRRPTGYRYCALGRCDQRRGQRGSAPRNLTICSLPAPNCCSLCRNSQLIPPVQPYSADKLPCLYHTLSSTSSLSLVLSPLRLVGFTASADDMSESKAHRRKQNQRPGSSRRQLQSISGVFVHF